MKCCALLLSLLLCLGLTGCAPAEVEIPAMPVQAAEAAEPPKPPPRGAAVLRAGPCARLYLFQKPGKEASHADPSI